MDKQKFFKEVNKFKSDKVALGKVDDLLSDIRANLFEGSQKAIGHMLAAVYELEQAQRESETNRTNYANYTTELQDLMTQLNDLGVVAEDQPMVREIIDALQEFGDEEDRRDNLDSVVSDLVKMLQ